jgi:diacylglycerol kinase (ATP)
MNSNLSLKRIFVVQNPVAGIADSQALRRKTKSFLEERGISFEIYTTTGEEDLKGVVHTAITRGFSRFIAIGGDGTVSRVANALSNSAFALGIIPGGTGNILARDLGIPLQFDPAIALATEGSSQREIDAMQMGEDLFVLNISVGITASTLATMKRQEKRRLGIFAYIWRGLLQIIGYQPRLFRLRIDGREIELRASEVLIANGGVNVFPALRLDPNISLDDGILGVYAIRARNLLDYAWLETNIMTGSRRPDPRMIRFHARKEIQIEADQPLPVQADGELVTQTPVRVSLISRAVKIVVPENPGS